MPPPPQLLSWLRFCNTLDSLRSFLVFKFSFNFQGPVCIYYMDLYCFLMVDFLYFFIKNGTRAYLMAPLVIGNASIIVQSLIRQARRPQECGLIRGRIAVVFWIPACGVQRTHWSDLSSTNDGLRAQMRGRNPLCLLSQNKNSCTKKE